jgi:2-oxoisovalerate dehydrogenase E1 component alpha subunit
MSGHSTSDDPKAYRPETWLDPWKAKDPIARLRKHVVRTSGWSDAQDKELEASVDAELRAAIKEAEAAPSPSLESLFEEVYSTLPWHLEEQRDALLRGPRAKKH